MMTGDKCVFCKSGAEVELLRPSDPYCGQKTWIVRVSNSDKQMIATEAGLRPIGEKHANQGIVG
jgi:hypothetical protein